MAQPLCLVCASPQVEVVFDLGAMPLANEFVPASELAVVEERFPLRLALCHGCGHVQLADRVPPERMFRRYLYTSSMSATLRAHFAGLAEAVLAAEAPGHGAFVVDIGSNDGSLAAAFAGRGARVLGVDPAVNLAGLALKRGVETVTAYFGARTASQIRGAHGAARVITATNSLPHIHDLEDYFQGVTALLAPEGTYVAEAHYLGDLDRETAFDTIYHEHVSYWSLAPLVRLAEAHGLEVWRADRLLIHHGQLRVWMQHRGRRAVEPCVGEILAEEGRRGLGCRDRWARFAARARRIGGQLTAELADRNGRRQRVAGYGAPAKASTLLNWLALGPDRIAYIADRSPLKQGLYTPGTHIPIVAPERILRDQPEAVLILAWNFAAEVHRELAGFRGEFLLPLRAAEDSRESNV
jgi:SAM-dependent methyltransferase